MQRAEDATAGKQDIATKARDEYEGARQLKKLQEEENNFVPLLAWAEVGQREREMARQQALAAQARGDAEKARERVEKVSHQKEDLDQKRGMVQRELDDLHARCVELSKAGESLAKEFKQSNKALKQLQTSKQQAEHEMITLKAEVDHVAEELARALDNYEAKESAQKAALQKKKQSLESRLEEARRAEADAQEEVDEAVRAYRKHEDAMIMYDPPTERDSLSRL